MLLVTMKNGAEEDANLLQQPPSSMFFLFKQPRSCEDRKLNYCTDPRTSKTIAKMARYRAATSGSRRSAPSPSARPRRAPFLSASTSFLPFLLLSAALLFAAPGVRGFQPPLVGTTASRVAAKGGQSDGGSALARRFPGAAEFRTNHKSSSSSLATFREEARRRRRRQTTREAPATRLAGSADASDSDGDGSGDDGDASGIASAPAATTTTGVAFVDDVVEAAAVSEEADDERHGGTDGEGEGDGGSRNKKVNVRRRYETFLWQYELREYNVNYRVEGPVDGPPILLVHGFGANVNHFRYQFPALAEAGYRVYAVDLIGFGASDKPASDDGAVEYSIELFGDLLVDFVNAMHPDKPWFVAGNSIGGLCSLVVAERLPRLIQGVVLFNCAGGMSGFRYEDVPFYLRPILYGVQKIVLGPRMGPNFFQNFKTRENVESILKEQGVYRDTTNVDEELLEILLGPSDDDGAEHVFLKVFAGPPGPTPESILPNVMCPVLAIWGGADPWTPHDAGAHPGTEFGRYFSTSDDDKPQYELQVLRGVGHCPHDECPDRVHAKMIPWMEAVRDKYDPTS